MSHKRIDGRTGWRHTGYVKKSACERCGVSYEPGSRKTLIVHHRDRNPANNTDLSNLETLCRKCHASEHADERAERQRDPEVNARRGAKVSASRTGKHYAETSEASKRQWAGESGEKLRASRRTDEFRKAQSERMKKLMNDPEHLSKRASMRLTRKYL